MVSIGAERPRTLVEPVTDSAGLRAFIEFPFKHYAHSRQWVPPFIEERTAFFNPRKNPFFDHARHQLFLARRDGEIVGTIGAVVDDNHNALHGERMGAFGFFELVEDRDVAAELLEAAETWTRTQGMTIIRGPLNFSTNQECGLLIDGFDQPPMVMMTYNPPYYARLLEDHEYRKAMDLFAYIGTLTDLWDNSPPKAFRVAQQVLRREGIRVRRADMRHFRRDVELAKQVYNRAWALNWGFVPMTEREFYHLANGLKMFLDPNLLLIAETADGVPVGVAISLPDLNQPLLWGAGGHMFPFGVVKMLWYRRKINQIRLSLMGVVPEWRGKGLEALFLVETVRSAMQRGYTRMEGSWILETNTMMRRISERLGMQHNKTYRIYEKSL